MFGFLNCGDGFIFKEQACYQNQIPPNDFLSVQLDTYLLVSECMFSTPSWSLPYSYGHTLLFVDEEACNVHEDLFLLTVQCFKAYFRSLLSLWEFWHFITFNILCQYHKKCLSLKLLLETVNQTPSVTSQIILKMHFNRTAAYHALDPFLFLFLMIKSQLTISRIEITMRITNVKVFLTKRAPNWHLIGLFVQC